MSLPGGTPSGARGSRNPVASPRLLRPLRALSPPGARLPGFPSLRAGCARRSLPSELGVPGVPFPQSSGLSVPGVPLRSKLGVPGIPFPQSSGLGVPLPSGLGARRARRSLPSERGTAQLEAGGVGQKSPRLPQRAPAAASPQGGSCLRGG